MTRRCLLLTLATLPGAAARRWEAATFPGWTPEFISRLLTDSPWAKERTVRFIYQPPADRLHSEYSQIEIPRGVGVPAPVPSRRPGSGWPGGSSGRVDPRVHAEAYLTTRFSSALPIRQALALQEFGRVGLHDERCVELLNRVERDYVIEVFGFPATMFSRDVSALEKDLVRTARVGLKGRSSARPLSVRLPAHGMHLAATLRFPRFETLTEDDGILLFTAEAGSMKIEQEFKLKTMVYRGRLEL